jgi:mRNA interferase HigB
MRVISKIAITRFAKLNPDSEKPLLIWYKLVRQHNFSSFAELKKIFAAADVVDNFTVFDVGGDPGPPGAGVGSRSNKYRIIARVIYKLKTVFIRNVFTHDEYDSWKAEDDPWSKKRQQARISKQKKLRGGKS